MLPNVFSVAIRSFRGISTFRNQIPASRYEYRPKLIITVLVLEEKFPSRYMPQEYYLLITLGSYQYCSNTN
jgi:hypothetical protein